MLYSNASKRVSLYLFKHFYRYASLLDIFKYARTCIYIYSNTFVVMRFYYLNMHARVLYLLKHSYRYAFLLLKYAHVCISFNFI